MTQEINKYQVICKVIQKNGKENKVLLNCYVPKETAHIMLDPANVPAWAYTQYLRVSAIP